MSFVVASPSEPPAVEHSEGDRQVAQVLALLEDDRAEAISIATLLERGVKSPAQAVYELQLAGYRIDRVSQTDSGGHTTLGYRLQGVAAAASGPVPVSSQPGHRDGPGRRPVERRTAGTS